MESPPAMNSEMFIYLRIKKGINFDPFFVPSLFFMLYLFSILYNLYSKNIAKHNLFQ